MIRGVSIGAAVLLACAAPAPAQDAASDDALRAEATANRARVQTPPKFLDGPKAELPDAEKALGHHGTAVIEGVVALDGRMHDAEVKTSSGAPALDSIALAAAGATRFEPATDAAGAPLPVLVSMPFDMVAYKSASGGAFEYRCGQFVRDMDWWRATYPERPWKEHELYKLQLGLIVLGSLGPALRDQAKLNKALDGFETKWTGAIEKCRRKPTILQMDAMLR